MVGRIRIFYQGPNRLCAVLHGSLRERSELQLRSDVARSVLHQLYPDREGKVRHPLENFLHHQPGPLRYCGPGYDPGLSRDRHSGPARFVLPGGICRHPGSQYGWDQWYSRPSRFSPGFPILHVWQHLRSGGSDDGSCSSL